MRASANEELGTSAENNPLTFTGDAASEKEAVKRRLGELHRLLNSRKVVANDKVYDFNEKSVQALDASAKGTGVVFEVTKASVTHEQETLEVGEELERTLKRASPSTGRSRQLERRANHGNQ